MMMELKINNIDKSVMKKVATLRYFGTPEN